MPRGLVGKRHGARRVAVWRAVQWILAVSALVLAAATPASASRVQRIGAQDGAALDALVLEPPSPVLATDQARHLVYEILVHNTMPSSLRLERLEVIDPARRRPVAMYSRSVIETVMFVASEGGITPTSTLPPDTVGVLVLDVRLSPGQPAPARLEHRFLLLRAGGEGPPSLTFTGAPTSVDLRAPVELGPPLLADNLGVLGCCGPPFTHRLALVEAAQGLVVAQRYAIDFVGVNDQLQTFAGDPTRNESYFVFGADVVAVAPGGVVAARDGVPENTPPGLPGDVALNDLTGNFVVQDLGGGRFALYAHLQPGSVRVRPGDEVHRGQKLGTVGNTGNSSEPHLHFHLMDSPGGESGLEAEGVPYVFDRFRLVGRVVGLDRNPPIPIAIPATPPSARVGQLPLTGDIVSFS